MIVALVHDAERGRLSLAVTGITEKLKIFVKREKTAAILVAMVLPLHSPTVIASELQGAAVTKRVVEVS